MSIIFKTFKFIIFKISLFHNIIKFLHMHMLKFHDIDFNIVLNIMIKFIIQGNNVSENYKYITVC